MPDRSADVHAEGRRAAPGLGKGWCAPPTRCHDAWMDAANESVVRRLVDAINSQQIAVMDELFHEDAVMEWPQSRERIVGGDNRRAVYGAFPALPTITPRRLVSEGELVTFEASMDYGEGGVFNAVFIFEFRDGKIARETAYWAAPFEPASWRAQWVERID